MRKISIIIPMIAPDRAARCIAAIRANASIPGVEYEVIAERDTEGIGVPAMTARLTAMTSPDAEFVMFLTDGALPQPGFLINALAAMERLPDGRGLVALNDGVWNGTRAVCWLAHKSLHACLPDGQFYSTAYHHDYYDAELTDIAAEHDCYSYAEDARVAGEDRHSLEGNKGCETQKDDLRTYRRRKIMRRGPSLGIGIPLVGTFREDDFWLSFLTLRTSGFRLYVPHIPIGAFTKDISALRNDIVYQALEDGVSSLLLLDTDQAYPPDTVEKLLSCADSADIAVGPVHRRYPPFELMLKRGEPDAYVDVPEEEKYSGEVIPIDAAGTGCMLINTLTFCDLDAPWFELSTTPSGKTLGEDFYFCAKARAAGKRIVADTSIEIGHLARIRIDHMFRQAYVLFNEGKRRKATAQISKAVSDTTEHPRQGIRRSVI